jgi:hypothetical protein
VAKKITFNPEKQVDALLETRALHLRHDGHNRDTESND